MVKTDCPRTHCENKATIDKTYGILPCQSCQDKDAGTSIRKSPEFYTISRSNRVQEQRDNHGADLVQPYDGDKPNIDFFKQYPEQVKNYGVEKELAKL